MSLTIVSWNVDGWHTITDDQLALLDTSGAELALLQEVTPASLDRLRAAGWPGTSATELLPEGHTELDGVRPRFSCAVLTRGRVQLHTATLVEQVPSPVRALAADVVLDGRQLHAVSAALPPGSRWGPAAKQGQAARLAAHLSGHTVPVVVGMDRNGPKQERWEPHRTVWWREDDPSFFAADAPHGLVDVLVRYFDRHPDLRVEARRARPEGPLAVSYVERRADPPVERRYDVILVNRCCEVTEVTYDYDRAVAAGSDHALIVAKTTWSPDCCAQHV